VFLVAILVALASPASAKCCELDHLTIEGPGVDVTLTHAELEDLLSDPDLTLVYWPAFNAMAKGDEAPGGDLGPRYEVTYLLANSEGTVNVSAREALYPFASPPVAFTHKGQRQNFDADDDRDYPIPWGWRPFPATAVKALFTPHVDSLPADAVAVLEGLPASNEQRKSVAPLAWRVIGGLALLAGLLAQVGRLSQPSARARTE
jgi:hypothetical protein